MQSVLRLVRILAVLGVVAALPACGQGTAPSSKAALRGAEYYESLEKARALADKKQSAEAAAIFDRLTHSYPDDVEVWMELGRARLAANQYREAAAAFEQVIARGGEYDGFMTYRIARTYALAGDKDKSLAWLEKSLAVPFENRPMIAIDTPFDAWREDDKLRQLSAQPAKKDIPREEAWNRDLDFFVAEVRRMYYSYRSAPLPGGFEDDVRRLRQRMPKLTDRQMVPEIQRLLARLGDGHTQLNQPSPRMPLRFYQFSDGVFVIDAPEDCHCIGERVLAVGATPIDTALQRIRPFLSVDNEMGARLKGASFLRFPDYLQAADIVPSAVDVTFTFENKDGVKRPFAVKTVDEPDPNLRLTPSKLADAGPVPRYMKNMYDFFWFEPLDAGRTVYFQFNQVFDKQDESIKQFAPKLRKAILGAGVRDLIIDMRHNSGGNLNLFPPLLRAIIAFQETRENAGIYVITSRYTFSAAQVFLNELDRYTSAVVVGEPSGSKPNFVGESAATRLPYSGWTMTMSTRYHQTEDQDRRTWIAPKVPVELSSADYFANRDPALEAVLKTIARKRAAIKR